MSSGIYQGGFQVYNNREKEGLNDAKEFESDYKIKDSLNYSHYGLKGRDAEVDFPEPAISNNAPKSGPVVVKRPIDREFLKKREHYEFSAKTDFTDFETVPVVPDDRIDELNPEGYDPEETAKLLVSTGDHLHYYGFRQIPKEKVSKEINNLYKLSSENLQGGPHPSGLLQGGFIRNYIVDRVKKAEAENKEWFVDEPEVDQVMAERKPVPDQFGDLDKY